MRYFPLALITALFFLGRPLNVMADELFLKNGRVIKGRIVKKTTGDIKVEVWYGSINVKRSEVYSIKEASSKENYLLLADGYKMRNDSQRAQAFYNLALELDPECREAKGALEELKGKAELAQNLKKKREDKIFNLNELAAQENGRQNYAQAMKYLKEAYSLDKGNDVTEDNLIELYLNYSGQLFKSGEKALAAELLAEGKRMFPENAELPILEGEFYYRDGNYDEAIRIWQEALKIFPDSRHIQSRLEEAFRLNKAKPFDTYYSGTLFCFKAPNDLNREEKNRLDSLIAVFKKAGENLGARLHYYPPKISNIIFYGGRDISPVIPSGIFYNGGEIVVSLPALKNKSGKEIEAKVTYACTNFFLDLLMGDNCPFWMREGFSLYLSGAPYDVNLLKEAEKKGNFLKLRRVEEFLRDNNAGELKELVSMEALGLVSYIVENYGEKFLYDSFKQIAQGTDYEDALELYLAVPFVQLNYEWVESVKK